MEDKLEKLRTKVNEFDLTLKELDEKRQTIFVQRLKCIGAIEILEGILQDGDTSI